MKKILLVLLAGVSIYTANAQKAQEVANAELAFAKQAVTTGMRDAFLKFLDSNGVVFSRGVISNGIQQWQASPDAPGKLLWHPAFAVIAASGDLGFTTGPYEFRRTMADSAAGSGQYSTIWHKTAAGEWKFLADMGISYPVSLFSQQSMEYFTALTPAADTAIFKLENKFIQRYQSDSIQAFREMLIPESWFNINRQPPVRTTNGIMAALEKVPQQLKFIPAGGGIASSKDFGYVYGTVQYKERKENYLRVWVHTNAGWKILLQVLLW